MAISDRSLGDGITALLALNEVVIEKIDFGHTVRLATSVDGEEALTYSADGLIIATPTGSTAYNLSAGGPILAPTLRAMVVTPVAPHFSLDRSLVLTENQEVTVEIAPDRVRCPRHRRAGDRAAPARRHGHVHRGRATRPRRAQRAPDLRGHPALPAARPPGPVSRPC